MVMHNQKHNIRTFIAFRLPDQIKNSLAEAQENLLESGIRAKYIPTQNMHLTLKFIGDMDQRQIPEIGEIMAACTRDVPPTKLSCRGIGAFPNIKLPRVVWAGLGGDTEILESLHNNLDRMLADLGLPRENRKFQGHLTLARLKGGKGDAKKLEHAMAGLTGFETEPFTVDRLVLFQSELLPEGPIYTEIFSAPMIGK